MNVLHQGDIVKIEGIKHRVLVVSNDVFNENSGCILGCPIFSDIQTTALHIAIHGRHTDGVVACEQVRFLDMNKRRWYGDDDIDISQIIETSDALQSIFEYI